MIRERNYTRQEIVRAEDIEQDRRSFLSSQAEYLANISTLSARVSLASACQVVTSAASLRVPSVVPETGVSITSLTTPVYPSGAAYLVKPFPMYGVIAMEPIESRSVFTTPSGKLRSSIEVTADSDLMFAFRPGVDEFYSSPAKYALTDPMPYLAVCKKEGLDDISMNLTISDIEAEFSLNALRIIPFPTAFSVTTTGISAKGTQPLLTGGAYLPRISGMDTLRSLPLYLFFRTFTTSELTISFLSDLITQSFNGALAIGVSTVVGEINTYPEKAYIGYAIDYPAGTTVLNTIKIFGTTEESAIAGLRIMIYTSEAEFNACSTSFVHLCENDNAPALSRPTSGRIWMLCEFSRTRGTTPALRKIKLDFS